MIMLWISSDFIVCLQQIFRYNKILFQLKYIKSIQDKVLHWLVISSVIR